MISANPLYAGFEYSNCDPGSNKSEVGLSDWIPVLRILSCKVEYRVTGYIADVG